MTILVYKNPITEYKVYLYMLAHSTVFENVGCDLQASSESVHSACAMKRFKLTKFSV